MRIKALSKFKAQWCILKYFCTQADSALVPDPCGLSRDAGERPLTMTAHVQYKACT